MIWELLKAWAYISGGWVGRVWGWGGGLGGSRDSSELSCVDLWSCHERHTSWLCPTHLSASSYLLPVNAWADDDGEVAPLEEYFVWNLKRRHVFFKFFLIICNTHRNTGQGPFWSAVWASESLFIFQVLCLCFAGPQCVGEGLYFWELLVPVYCHQSPCQDRV